MKISVCPDDCEYKDFDYYMPDGARIDYCTLEYGLEEPLKETEWNSGKFKRTEFCKKIKFLEESEVLDKEKCKKCANGDGEQFEPINDEMEEQEEEDNER